jgi:hypothetical protein
MKILTICHMGHCRSVATASFLKTRGYDAIALGLNYNSKETFDMLIDWADRILVADQPVMNNRLPEKALEKIDKRFHIGEDEWGNPSDNSLWTLIENQLDGFGDYPHIRREETYK